MDKKSKLVPIELPRLTSKRGSIPTDEHYTKVCSKNMDILIKKDAFQNVDQKELQDSSPEITSKSDFNEILKSRFRGFDLVDFRSRREK